MKCHGRSGTNKKGDNDNSLRTANSEYINRRTAGGVVPKLCDCLQQTDLARSAYP